MNKLSTLCIAICIISCGTKEENTSNTRASMIEVMTTPVYESALSNTDVLYSDYLGDKRPDSVSTGLGIRVRESINMDRVYTFEMEEQDPFLSHITLWTEGIRNDIPVFKNNSRTIKIPYNGSFKNVSIKGKFTNGLQRSCK